MFVEEKLAALAEQHELANQSISAIQMKEDALREVRGAVFLSSDTVPSILREGAQPRVSLGF